MSEITAIAIAISIGLYAILCVFIAGCLMAAGRADEREREMEE